MALAEDVLMVDSLVARSQLDLPFPMSRLELQGPGGNNWKLTGTRTRTAGERKDRFFEYLREHRMRRTRTERFNSLLGLVMENMPATWAE